MMRRDNTAKGAALGEARGRTWNRLNNQKGFSLAETLLAVLILLLVSLIVANGMPAATNAYNKIILGANARTMLSTAINALHDEIGTAWKVDNINDTTIEYFNASTGAKSRISLNEKKHIIIQDYVALNEIGDLIHDEDYLQDKEESIKKGHDLVSDSTSTMYATYSAIHFDPSTGVVTVSGLKIVKASDNTTELAVFSDPNGFKIRVISNDYID